MELRRLTFQGCKGCGAVSRGAVFPPLTLVPEPCSLACHEYTEVVLRPKASVSHLLILQLLSSVCWNAGRRPTYAQVLIRERSQTFFTIPGDVSISIFPGTVILDMVNPHYETIRAGNHKNGKK